MHIDISNKQHAALGIYFHVPFCPHLCPYCDFVKTDLFSKPEVDFFFQNLLLLAKQRINELYSSSPEKRAVTVYFGGGTPGLFWGSRYLPILEFLREKFSIEECTIETNPAFVSERKIQSWFDVGFDRVTLGVQSCNEKVLHFLGRKHSLKQVLQALDWSKKAGFVNIQADLIYGLPQDFSKRDIALELETLDKNGATGISSYALTVEKNTLFSDMKIQPSEDLACNEYELIQSFCESAGMPQRETSNFSRFECKHNNIYWYGYPYEGLGPGAHGLEKQNTEYPYGRRYSVGKWSAGSKRPQAVPGRDQFQFFPGKIEDFRVQFEQARSRSDYLIEMLFTLLRTPLGVPLAWLSEHFPEETLHNLENNPFLLEAQAKGKISWNVRSGSEKHQTPGLRLSKNQYLLGDWWHQKLATELGIL